MDEDELIRGVNRKFYEAMRTYYVLSRSASVQGGNAMGNSFKAGDRVESGIGLKGRVISEYEGACWVLWDNEDAPRTYEGAALRPEPLKVGDRVKVRDGIWAVGMGHDGTVKSVMVDFLWVQFDGISVPATVRRAHAVRVEEGS